MGVEGFVNTQGGEESQPPVLPEDTELDPASVAEQVARRHQFAARIADLEVRCTETSLVY